jgi:ATP-binding cassette subfamily B protein
LLTEAFSNIRLVKALAAEPYEIQRFSQTARGNWQAKYLAERVKAIQVLVVGFLEALGVLLLLLLGGWQIAQGNLTGQGFVSFMVAVLALIDPISFGTSGYNEFKQGEASVDRVFELFERQPSVIDKPGAIALPPVTGKVEYRNVCFAYNAEKPILQNFSLLARPGQAIALVGTSGAGKTTLINLLLRFYDPSAGRILIDGVDIQAVTLQSLRRQIGLVPQETILFSGTIAQNIAFGQDDFELEAVEAAARVANAHGFITQFPDGYYTWVGERGVNLSGGQRQRLAIARAVFRNPRILILDEATSALDSESETLVQQALEQVMVDRTVFIIAHRLATVRRCDRILVLEQGQIIESGTHADLLTKNGRYAQFYAQQFSQ